MKRLTSSNHFIMKKTFLLLPVLLLLVSCQSETEAKKETCALEASRQITEQVAAKKLGIVDDPDGIDLGVAISNYCRFYRE